MQLTKDKLRKIVQEEYQKLVDADGKKVPEAEEVEPGDEANTLEKPIDVAKALKINESLKKEEAKFVKRLEEIRQKRAALVKSLVDG